MLDISWNSNQSLDWEEEASFQREMEVERDGRKLNQSWRRLEDLRKQKFTCQERQIREK